MSSSFASSQSAQPHRQRLARHLARAHRSPRRRLRACVSWSRTRRTPDRDARAGLVERDVSVAAKAEDHEVDRRLVEERLVASALGFGVGRRPVDPVDGAEADAAQARARDRRGSCARRRRPGRGTRRAGTASPAPSAGSRPRRGRAAPRTCRAGCGRWAGSGAAAGGP